MDIKQLKRKLDEEGINPKEYSLDGTLKPMSTVIFFLKNEWTVLDYDERGRISEKKIFKSEDEACIYALDHLIYIKEWRKKII